MHCRTADEAKLNINMWALLLTVERMCKKLLSLRAGSKSAHYAIDNNARSTIDNHFRVSSASIFFLLLEDARESIYQNGNKSKKRCSETSELMRILCLLLYTLKIAKNLRFKKNLCLLLPRAAARHINNRYNYSSQTS